MDGHTGIEIHKSERFMNYAERIFEKSSISKNRKKRHKIPPSVQVFVEGGWSFVTLFSVF